MIIFNSDTDTFYHISERFHISGKILLNYKNGMFSSSLGSSEKDYNGNNNQRALTCLPYKILMVLASYGIANVCFYWIPQQEVIIYEMLTVILATWRRTRILYSSYSGQSASPVYSICTMVRCLHFLVTVCA